VISLEKKKILVTGGGGFLGSFVVKKLIERGVPRANISIPNFGEYDLRKLEDCKKVVGNSEIVIHLAANTGGAGYHEGRPGELFYDNITMNVFMMEAVRGTAVEKYVSIGSATAYPESAPVPYKEDYLWTGYPQKLNAPYSFAKLMQLVQGQAYRTQYGLNAIHLMLVNMYGPGDKFDLLNGYVIPALIRKIDKAKGNKGDFIEVWGTGKATREFLYVEDAAEGIVLATEKYDKPDPVNIGSGMEISIKDLVELICRLMEFKGRIRWDSSRPDGQLRRALDISRAKSEFGFEASTSLEEGLGETIKWWREEGYKEYKEN